MPLKTAEKVLNNLSQVGYDEEYPENGRDCLPFSQNEFHTAEELILEACRLKYLGITKGMECNCHQDAFGNVYVTLSGQTNRKIIVTSHLDSVPKGGKYDGLLGVSGGMAAIKYLIDKGEIPKKTVQLIACRAEESSVTGQACLGSLLATGAITIEELQKRTYEENGKPKIPLLKYIIKKTGLTKAQIQEALDNPEIKIDDIDGAVEMHIEQSGVLEMFGKGVGVVTGGIGSANRKKIQIQENRSMVTGQLEEIKFDGLANHSGGTPMNGERIRIKNQEERTLYLRNDALVKAIKDISKKSGIRIKSISTPDGSYNTVAEKCVVEYVEEGKGTDEVECISNEVVDAVFEIIQGTESIAETIAQRTNGLARATIGHIKQEHGVITLYLDQRMLDEKVGKELINQLKALIDSQLSPEVQIDTVQDGNGNPVKFEGDLKEELVKTYKDLFGEEPLQMSSMPGHDLSKLIKTRSDGTKVPGAMIFIRSLNEGVSHNPNEYSSPEDIKQGTRLLCEFLGRIANQ